MKKCFKRLDDLFKRLFVRAHFRRIEQANNYTKSKPGETRCVWDLENEG